MRAIAGRPQRVETASTGDGKAVDGVAHAESWKPYDRGTPDSRRWQPILASELNSRFLTHSVSALGRIHRQQPLEAV